MAKKETLVERLCERVALNEGGSTGFGSDTASASVYLTPRGRVRLTVAALDGANAVRILRELLAPPPDWMKLSAELSNKREAV